MKASSLLQLVLVRCAPGIAFFIWQLGSQVVAGQPNLSVWVRDHAVIHFIVVISVGAAFQLWPRSGRMRNVPNPGIAVWAAFFSVVLGFLFAIGRGLQGLWNGNFSFVDVIWIGVATALLGFCVGIQAMRIGRTDGLPVLPGRSTQPLS